MSTRMNLLSIFAAGALLIGCGTMSSSEREIKSPERHGSPGTAAPAPRKQETPSSEPPPHLYDPWASRQPQHADSPRVASADSL